MALPCFPLRTPMDTNVFFEKKEKLSKTFPGENNNYACNELKLLYIKIECEYTNVVFVLMFILLSLIAVL